MAATDEGAGAIQFGSAIRDQFFLDPDKVYLNHGAFGAISRPVYAAAEEWRHRIETHPSRFLRLELPVLLRETADVLGNYVGAKGEDIVFVDNATTAINAVLRSLVLMPGDEVITTNHTYGAVLRTLEFVCDRADARLIIVPVPFPCSSPDEVLDAVTNGLTPRTRLAVLDHITSKTALIFPIAELVEECRDRGILTLVDGAHAPGMIPALNIEALGCDFYAANCHKWLGAPRGSAFLWTAPEHQSGLRPTTISHGIGDGYIPAFDWPGTKDFAPYLTIPDALKFRESLGGDQAIWDYCHGLAQNAGVEISAALNSVPGAPARMTSFMCTVAMPSNGQKQTQKEADALRNRLFSDQGIEIDAQLFDGRIWLRLCFYLHNNQMDIDAVRAAMHSGVQTTAT